MGKAKRSVNQELMSAAIQGDAARLALAIASGADVDYKDEGGRSALFRIASRQGFHAGMAECASILLDAGASCAEQAAHGQASGSPLVWAFSRAASSGRVEIALAMCENERVADSRELDGSTALMMAIKMGREECFDLLMARGGCERTNHAGESALMWAAGLGDARKVCALLPHSDIGAVDKAGLDAVDWAFYARQPQPWGQEEKHAPLDRAAREQKDSGSGVFHFLAQAVASQVERCEMELASAGMKAQIRRAL